MTDPAAEEERQLRVTKLMVVVVLFLSVMAVGLIWQLSRMSLPGMPASGVPSAQQATASPLIMGMSLAVDSWTGFTLTAASSTIQGTGRQGLRQRFRSSTLSDLRDFHRNSMGLWRKTLSARPGQAHQRSFC